MLAYLASQSLDQLFLSTVTIAEIRYGILTAQTEDRKLQLERWLQDDVSRISAGTLPVTEAVWFTGEF